MGHIRLGRLPKTHKWREVFKAFESDNLTAETLAQAISKSTQKEFDSLKGDRSISFCYWVLTTIVSAANTDSFTDRLESVGIKTKDVKSGLEFVKNVAHFISESLSDIGRNNAFSNIAELSVNETIANVIIEKSTSLFGTTIDDIQLACKSLSTQKQFGLLSRRFFSNFLKRSIQFVADKELSNYLGKSKAIETSSDILSFQKSLSLYCYQSSKIIEEFSGGWFSKEAWKTKNKIPLDSAKGFMAYALKKVNMELSGGQA